MSEAKPTEESKEPADTAAAAAPAAPDPAPAPAADPAPEPVKPKDSTAAAPSNDPDDHVGKRMCKKFDNKSFYGEITEKWADEEDKSPRWHVKYDDGDEEDLNEKELAKALKKYEQFKRYDYKIYPRKPRAPRKKREIEPPPPRTSKYPKRGMEKKD